MALGLIGSSLGRHRRRYRLATYLLNGLLGCSSMSPSILARIAALLTFITYVLCVLGRIGVATSYRLGNLLSGVTCYWVFTTAVEWAAAVERARTRLAWVCSRATCLGYPDGLPRSIQCVASF